MRPVISDKKFFPLVAMATRILHGIEFFDIAPDKAAYCVFMQFRGPENAIKFISVRTKTQ